MCENNNIQLKPHTLAYLATAMENEVSPVSAKGVEQTSEKQKEQIKIKKDELTKENEIIKNKALQTVEGVYNYLYC